MDEFKTPCDEIVLGKRAFDEKPAPPPRLNEWVSAARTHRPHKQGEPVKIRRDLLRTSHIFCRGRTRCGKTATTVLPVYRQALRPCTVAWQTADGQQCERTDRSAIIVIDLKGEKSFLNSCKRMAEQAGRDFKFLTTDPERTWSFNPMSSFRGDIQDAPRAGTGLLTAMQLDLGGGYGAAYFTTQTLALLYEVCTHLSLIKLSGRQPTIDDAIRYVKKNARAAPKDSDQLISILTLLSFYPQLQPAVDDPFVIDFKEAIARRQVVMVSVDALNQGPMARLFAGLALHATLSAATAIAHEREGDPSPGPHTLCIIDEFHHIVGKSLRDLLTGSAGVGLTFALSCQTSETLKQRFMDLNDTVRDNCAVKIYHTAYGDDIDELQSYSRETIRPLGSRKVDADIRFFGLQALAPETETDRIERQLTVREIQEVSATPNRCFVLLDDEIEPIPTDTFFAESYAEHLASAAAPIPKSPSTRLAQPEAAETAGSPQPRPHWLAAHLSSEKSPVHAARLERLGRLLKSLKSELA
ncbi:MAG: hypothetical protein CMJ58_15185 [Planctomycetaceae bacterium]|nr:hypothetical protein [Planctomycetaceae bacterium]